MNNLYIDFPFFGASLLDGMCKAFTYIKSIVEDAERRGVDTARWAVVGEQTCRRAWKTLHGMGSLLLFSDCMCDIHVK